MSKLHFSTDIQAPRATVWNVLWNDATYREWTSVFSEGSYAVSDWNEGSKVQFLDSTGGSGMSAVIQQKASERVHVLQARGRDQERRGTAAGRMVGRVRELPANAAGVSPRAARPPVYTFMIAKHSSRLFTASRPGPGRHSWATNPL